MAEDVPLEDALRELLAKLEPAWDELVLIGEEQGGRTHLTSGGWYADDGPIISFNIEIYEDWPALGLDRTLVQKIAELNASLDLDTYDLRGPETE
jgi:hypothetical protein